MVLGFSVCCSRVSVITIQPGNFLSYYNNATAKINNK